MRRVLMSTILAAALLVMPAALQARGHGGHGGHGGRSHSVQSHVRVHRVHNHVQSYKNYHLAYGKKFSHGFYYKGKYHHHWRYRSWWSKYGCYCYYCPSTCCWYYWCQPQDCYLPVSYVNVAPPTSNDPGTSLPESEGTEGAVPPPPGGGSVQGFTPGTDN